MKAFRFHHWKQAGRLEDVPVPEPGPGETLIRIGGAGACHSDLHVMHEWSPEAIPQLAGWSLPFTLGHENAGWIEGGETAGMEIGTPVVISPVWGCGKCRSCRAGADNYCDHPNPSGSGGLGRDGGMAEYMVVPFNAIVPLNSLEPADAAPLTDAGLTSYHAVKQCLTILTPDTAAVVIGVGGLGHLAVEFLSVLSGAQIIAVDRDEKALKIAAEKGASLCLPSDESTAERIKDATRGLGAMAVLDFVGIDATLAMAAQSLRHMGLIVVVGIGGDVLPFSYNTIPRGCALMTVLGGSTRELAEVVALAEAGKVKPHIQRFSLEEVDVVYKKLQANEIAGRAVLIP
jgi:propanol-preferring alcohol dehydrogenase